MHVRDEPRASDARAILTEILEPHGVAVREGPGGLLLLVRKVDSQSPDEQLADAAGNNEGSHTPTLKRSSSARATINSSASMTFPLSFLSAADSAGLARLATIRVRRRAPAWRCEQRFQLEGERPRRRGGRDARAFR